MAPWSSSHVVPPPLEVEALMKHPSPSPGTGDTTTELSAIREMGVEGTHPGTTEPRSVSAAPTGTKDSRLSGFILDSGAAVHATGTSELITNPIPPSEGAAGVFRTRAGKDLAVAAVGSIATPRFVIPDVHLVPVLGHGRTLISVRQLARRGLAVAFGSKSCSIKEHNTGAVIGEGRLKEEDGFYYLDHLRVPPR